MGNVKIRYLVSRPRKSGIAWYWQPTKKLIMNGFLPRRLSDDLAEAVQQAEILNGKLDAWYSGTASVPVKPDSVKALVILYRSSDAYTRLAPRTQQDYDTAIKLIEEWCGDFLARSLTRRAIKAWMRELEKQRGKRTSQKTVMTLAALLTFALDEDWIDTHPAREMKIRLGDGRQQVWTPDQVNQFVAAANNQGRPSMALAMMLAYCLAQREGDVLALPWTAYDGSTITLRQSKTGTVIRVPALPELRTLLNGTERIAVQMVANERTRRPYHRVTFQHTFKAIRDAAGLPSDLWFADLRRTAATALGRAGCTEDEIRAIGGWRSRQVILATFAPIISMPRMQSQNLSNGERTRVEQKTRTPY